MPAISPTINANTVLIYSPNIIIIAVITKIPNTANIKFNITTPVS